MRDPDYQFVGGDTEDLVSGMVGRYEELTGMALRPASPERLIIQWAAFLRLLTRAEINRVGNQNLPSRAADENLDALGQLFYDSVRPEAQPAISTERFYISTVQPTSILIPAGTKVTDAGASLVWATEADTYIGVGSLYADVRIVCQTAGTEGNGYAIGQINSLIDIDNIPFYDHCENITVSGGGSNRADDDEYYELMGDSENAYSTAGAKGAYVYHVKKVSTEIADVMPNSLSPGCVNIFILMKDGTLADTEVKKKALEACASDDKRPLTDNVSVDDAEIVGYDISLTYYIPSLSPKSATEYEMAVAEAVERYVIWQRGKFGRDINPDELRKLVMATGVKRVELTSPAFTPLRSGYDNTVPQIATIGIVNIVNGGYEDE